jgi:hypothetical protein
LSWFDVLLEFDVEAVSERVRAAPSGATIDLRIVRERKEQVLKLAVPDSAAAAGRRRRV